MMELRIDSKLLDEQIALCEKYEFHGDNNYEQNLFGGIAELLTEISVALESDETVNFFEILEEE